MHPSISQRRAILKGLRERTNQATAELYQKPNVIAPSLAPQIIVIPVGGNNFEVTERATGKVVAERFGHNTATGHARVLEGKVQQMGAKQLGRILSDWSFRVGIMLVLFALFSNHI